MEESRGTCMSINQPRITPTSMVWRFSFSSALVKEHQKLNHEVLGISRGERAGAPTARSSLYPKLVRNAKIPNPQESALIAD